MKRYISLISKANKAVLEAAQKNEAIGTEQETVNQQTTNASQVSSQVSQARTNENYKVLQKQLREKNIEFEKLRKANEEMLKKQEELLNFQMSAIKEKQNNVIKNELQKVAKKLNVRDAAFDDILNLVAGKFTVSDDAVFVEFQKEEDGKQVIEHIDPETFMGTWLQGKDHFVQPPQTQASMISPVATGAKPVIQQTPQATKQGRPVFSNEDFFNPSPKR